MGRGADRRKGELPNTEGGGAVRGSAEGQGAPGDATGRAREGRASCTDDHGGERTRLGPLCP